MAKTAPKSFLLVGVLAGWGGVGRGERGAAALPATDIM